MVLPARCLLKPCLVEEAQIDVLVFIGSTGAVFAVAWSPVSNLVATGGADDRVFLWQVLCLELCHRRSLDS